MHATHRAGVSGGVCVCVHHHVVTAGPLWLSFSDADGGYKFISPWGGGSIILDMAMMHSSIHFVCMGVWTRVHVWEVGGGGVEGYVTVCVCVCICIDIYVYVLCQCIPCVCTNVRVCAYLHIPPLQLCECQSQRRSSRKVGLADCYSTAARAEAVRNIDWQSLLHTAPLGMSLTWNVRLSPQSRSPC